MQIPYRTITEISTDQYHGSWYGPVLSFFLLFFGSVGLGFFIGLVCAIVILPLLYLIELKILKIYFGNTQAGSRNYRNYYK